VGFFVCGMMSRFKCEKESWENSI